MILNKPIPIFTPLVKRNLFNPITKPEKSIIIKSPISKIRKFYY